MAFEREHRLDTELRRLLDDLAAPSAPELARVPGKRTLIEQMTRELTRQEMARAETPILVPGRRTLVQRLVDEAPKLAFEDYLVIALRDVLALLDRKALRAKTLAAADRDVARRATGERAMGAASRDGRAMWRLAERRAASLYRRAAVGGDAAPNDAATEAAIARAGGGAPLPGDVRRPLEGRLGVSLDRLRVHTDPVAAQAARALRTQAFHLGDDIFFASNAFAPDTEAGQKLIEQQVKRVVRSWPGAASRRVATAGPAMAAGGGAAPGAPVKTGAAADAVPAIVGADRAATGAIAASPDDAAAPRFALAARQPASAASVGLTAGPTASVASTTGSTGTLGAIFGTGAATLGATGNSAQRASQRRSAVVGQAAARRSEPASASRLGTPHPRRRRQVRPARRDRLRRALRPA